MSRLSIKMDGNGSGRLVVEFLTITQVVSLDLSF